MNSFDLLFQQQKVEGDGLKMLKHRMLLKEMESMEREAALLEGILNEKKEVLQKQVLQKREQKEKAQRNAALVEELTVHSRQLAQDIEAQNINKQTVLSTMESTKTRLFSQMKAFAEMKGLMEAEQRRREAGRLQLQALRQDLQAARDTFQAKIRNELAAFDPQTLRAQLQFLMTTQQEGKQLEGKKLQLQKENEQIRAELETVRQDLDEAFAARKKEEICVEELNGKLCEIKSILKERVIELDEMKKKNARLREENEKKIKAKKEAEQRQVKASKEPTPRKVSFEEEEDTEVMMPVEQNSDHNLSSAVSDALPSHPTPRRSSTSKNRFELDMLVDLMGADDSMIDSRTDEDEFNFTVSFIPERVKHNNNNNNDKDRDENKSSQDSNQGKEKKKVPATRRRRDSSFRPRNQITPDYNVFRAEANPLFTSTPHRSRVSNFFDPKSLNRMPTVRGIATTSTSRRSRPRK